eukprot:CAMPEP_0184349420 /NCGR_PEP_ID=MMETSP1089-20130417/32728_1 /TAXON_ID=38269 ORGANISM="Gloeochaete wittrockiana, Strain SAG46.84" /NCGR_SAMPLE_ID=MMETSP1089 /ASSEMBLY_ACC=CAM_ASM_000445 /LENGTH=341 /DNA_ID=CAMNT_0026681603 /DNA_START=510 /DNA_END=1531 /DNA_ORIENTATION=+
MIGNRLIRRDDDVERRPGAGRKGIYISEGKYHTLSEVKGRIFDLSRDKEGSIFLQNILSSKNNALEVDEIFVEIFPRISDLFEDPLGNYVIQKLIPLITERQQKMVINHVAPLLIKFSTNQYGAHSVQALVKVAIGSQEMIDKVVEAVKGDLSTLFFDKYGQHVALALIQTVPKGDKRQFIYDAMKNNVVKTCQARNGAMLSLMTTLLDEATSGQKATMLGEILRNVSTLCQDAFGHHLMVHIVQNFPGAATRALATKLLEKDSVCELACSKFACHIIDEMLNSKDIITCAAVVGKLAPADHLLTHPIGKSRVEKAMSIADLHPEYVTGWTRRPSPPPPPP